MADTYTHIFWDWHGVLGMKGFWHKSARKDEKLAQLVKHIFKNQDQVNAWMKGEVSVDDLINTSKTDITKELLAKYFLDDWKETDAINIALFSVLHGLHPHAKHMIITDNMDVFDHYSLGNSFIKDNFTRVFNSYKYGLLKDDMPGLFEKVLSELELDSFKGCLLLDDSASNCERFESLGGKAILVTRNTA